MKVSQINKTNFKAGSLTLNRIKPEKFYSYESIKKIAEDKNMDIFIIKNQKSAYLPKEDMYTVMASSIIPIIQRGFYTVGYKTQYAMSCMIANNKISKEELSVKIFNSAITAIESLEKKLAGLKIKRTV